MECVSSLDSLLPHKLSLLLFFGFFLGFAWS
jgi:hypothetical protein